MAPRPQIIGQSAHAPDGSDAVDRADPAATSRDGAPPAVVPEPAPRPDPTRYGDWERNGRCIDF